VSVSAANTVNLFQPSATLTKTASPTVAQVGDAITYHFQVTNTSSADSPNLTLGTAYDSFTDTLLGDLEATAIANGCGDLAPGAMCSFSVTRPVLANDPKPLTNQAAVNFTLERRLRFRNIITAQSAIVSVDVVDAKIAIAPSGVNAVGTPHTFTITVTAFKNDQSNATINSVTITPSVSPAPDSQSST